MRTTTAILAAWAALGAAAAEAQVAAVAGAGSRSCSQMAADVSELPNVRRSYVSWMQGFVSAMNASREAGELPPIDVGDYERQWQWIVAWCAERPQRTFAEAATALFADLAASGGRR